MDDSKVLNASKNCFNLTEERSHQLLNVRMKFHVGEIETICHASQTIQSILIVYSIVIKILSILHVKLHQFKN